MININKRVNWIRVMIFPHLILQVSFFSGFVRDYKTSTKDQFVGLYTESFRVPIERYQCNNLQTKLMMVVYKKHDQGENMRNLSDDKFLYKINCPLYFMAHLNFYKIKLPRNPSLSNTEKLIVISFIPGILIGNLTID